MCADWGISPVLSPRSNYGSPHKKKCSYILQSENYGCWPFSLGRFYTLSCQHVVNFYIFRDFLFSGLSGAALSKRIQHCYVEVQSDVQKHWFCSNDRSSWTEIRITCPRIFHGIRANFPPVLFLLVGSCILLGSVVLDGGAAFYLIIVGFPSLIMYW